MWSGPRQEGGSEEMGGLENRQFEQECEGEKDPSPVSREAGPSQLRGWEEDPPQKRPRA